jgi:hypothetical protein
MINDLTDLKPLLSRYDAGRILVGPLLSLSINSNFRHFYVAGKGSKIYASIGLGVVEAESTAQKQRADLVEKLQSHFGEVKTFDSPLEMARLAQTLWPNEETARVLAVAEREAKPQPTTTTDQRDIVDDDCYAEALVGDFPNRLADALARTQAEFNEAASTNAQPSSVHDQGQPTLLSPAPTLAPLRLPDTASSWPLGPDRVVTQKRRHSGLSQDDLELAMLELRSSMGMVQPGESAQKRRASTIFRFCVVAGAAVLIAAIVILPSTRRVAEKTTPAPTPSISADHDTSSSRTAAAVTPSIPANQIANADESTPQPPPTSVIPSQPTQAAKVQTNNAPASGSPSTPPEAANVQANASPVSGPQSSPPIASVEAGAAPSSGPSSSPSQEAGMQASTAPVSVAPSTPPQAADIQANGSPASESQSSPPVATVQAGATPTSEPQSSPPVATVEAGATPSSGPPSPSPQVADIQANASSAFEPQSSLPAATLEAGATPSSGPPSPSPPAASVQANAAPVSASPVERVETGAATSPGLPSTPPQATSVQAGEPVSRPQSPQVASVEAGPAPAPGLLSPQAQGAGAVARLDADEVVMLVSRANDFLKSGDFASARLLLRRAAEAGNANAALKLGATFDPAFMHALGAIGIAPDIAQARQWYEKAVELGSDDARQRLARLGQTGH